MIPNHPKTAILNSVRLHHIGRISNHIEDDLVLYARLGLAVSTQVLDDQEQGVRVGQVQLTDSLLLELIEPLNQDSPIWRSSQERTGLSHLCFEVDNIDKTMDKIKTNKLGFALTKKTLSVFDQWPVQFFATNDRQIFELIEKKPLP